MWRNTALVLASFALFGCEAEPAPAPEVEAPEPPEWTRFQEAQTKLRAVRDDVEKRIESARGRLTDCHKGIAAKAQAALPPEKKELASGRTSLPTASVLKSAPINPRGIQFEVPSTQAKMPCGASDTELKSVQDDVRKVLAKIPFTPKGQRACRTSPMTPGARTACAEGIAFLDEVRGEVAGLGEKVTEVVPKEIVARAQVVATDREYCVQAKEGGVQFTTRTLYPVTCSRARFWVDLKSGEVVGEVSRLHKQPPVRPEAADPSKKELGKAQDETWEKAGEGARARVDRAAGIKGR